VLEVACLPAGPVVVVELEYVLVAGSYAPDFCRAAVFPAGPVTVELALYPPVPVVDTFDWRVDVLPAGPVRITVELAARGGRALASLTPTIHNTGNARPAVTLITTFRFVFTLTPRWTAVL